MAAITNDGTNATTFSGEYRLVSMYNLALTSHAETLTLTAADNGISEIQNVMVCPNAGTDAAFQTCNASFSGLVVTIDSTANAGLAATDFTGATCNLIVIGK